MSENELEWPEPKRRLVGRVMIWQPIETAPRDGTEIIGLGLMIGDYGYTPDHTTWTGISWCVNGWQTTKPQGRHFCGFVPTHWMPLPHTHPRSLPHER